MKHVEPTWLARIEEAFGLPTSLMTIRSQGFVPQDLLARLDAFDTTMRNAQRQYKTACARYALHVAPVIAALRAGIATEPGALQAALRKSARRNVKWRQEFERVTSRETAAALLAATPAVITLALAITKTKQRATRPRRQRIAA